MNDPDTPSTGAPTKSEPGVQLDRLPSGWPTARAAAWLVFAFHALGLLLTFDPPSTLWSNEPLIEQDYGLHYHHLRSARALWRNEGRLWGYNPKFMAAYPSNTIQDASIKLFEFASLFAPEAHYLRVFKLTIFALAAFVPWMFYFGASNFFDSRRVAAVAAALGSLYWWNSLPREMIFYGMVGFPLAAAFSLLLLSLFYKLLTRGSSGLEGSGSLWPWGLAWCALCLAIIPLHVQAAVLLVPPGLIILAMTRRTASRASWAWIAGGIILACVVNAPWIATFVSHRADDASVSMVDALPLFSSLDPLTFVKDYFTGAAYWTFRTSIWEKGLRWTLLVLGVAGCVQMIREGRRAIGMALLASIVILFFLAYAGSLIGPLRGWQPLRFKVPADWTLAMGAAYLIGQASLASLRGWRGKACAVLLAAGVICSVINIARSESTLGMRFRTELNPGARAIIEWARERSPADGRILFEESGDESGFVYGGAYLSNFIAHGADRELIGGPINLYNDRHHFSEFHAGMLFKRPIESFTDEELIERLRVYNIGSIVAFTPQSVDRFTALGDLVRLDRRVGQIALMIVNQPLDWLIEGSGHVEARLGSIYLTELSGDRVVLKYHWIAGLVAEPPATLSPIHLLDDPIPFIEIVDPPGELVLRVGR